MCHLITKGDACVRLDRSGKRFPVTESNESAFLSPQPVDKKAEKDISVYRRRRKPFGTDKSSPLALVDWLWM